MTSDLGVNVAIVDVDQQVLVREGQPQPLHEVDHVWPGDKADVRKAIVRGSESESGNEHAAVMLSRQRGREHVEHADQRRDPAGTHLETQLFTCTHQYPPTAEQKQSDSPRSVPARAVVRTRIE